MSVGRKIGKRKAVKYRKLLAAVNDYLLAQNSEGFRDGHINSANTHTRCSDARRALCEIAYELNATASSQEQR